MRRPAARARKPARKAIKRVVKQVMMRAMETKCAQTYNLGKSLYPTNSGTFGDNVIELGVDGVNLVVGQGTGQGSRIGNEILTQRVLFKGTVVPNPYDVTVNPNPRPVQLRMIIYYDRTIPTSAPSVTGNDMFQDGGSSSGFQNDLVDLWRPYNTDRYRILMQRTWKIGFAGYGGTALVPANAQAQQYYENNDFKLNINFSIDVTKYYPKIVKFNDTTNTPTSRGLFALFYYSAADGTQLPSTNVSLGMQYMIDYKFKDA